MHSSRMRTARSSSHGGAPPGTPQGAGTPLTAGTPGAGTPQEQAPPWE